MHPLKHPRNAALVGVVFIVLAFVYWFLPTYGGWHVDYAGNDDALRARGRDGDDGLRAGGRVPRVTASDRVAAA